MTYLPKKIITSIVLASFIMVVFFSFTYMIHQSDGRMAGDCPFFSNSQSICNQNTILSAIHHISAYQSFLNIQTVSNITAGLISLLFLVALVFAVAPKNLYPLTSSLYPSDQNNHPPAVSGKEKITRWLSLFENSPSVI